MRIRLIRALLLIATAALLYPIIHYAIQYNAPNPVEGPYTFLNIVISTNRMPIS
jgi:hypothetical protein